MRIWDPWEYHDANETTEDPTRKDETDVHNFTAKVNGVPRGLR